MKEENKAISVPPSKGYLLVDTKKCSGCMACMMACSLAHEGIINPAYSRIQIKKNVFGTFPNDDIEQYVCRQCETPACLLACKVGALYVDPETGVRMIDEEKCIGCKMCMKACPYTPTRIVWNVEAKVAMKCDLCANTPYWDQEGGAGGKQACISACPLKAIVFTSEMPEQSDKGYNVNLRKSLHYARMNFPIDDDGVQPPKEAVAEAGLKPTGGSVGRSFWDDPDTSDTVEKGEE